VSTEAEDIVGIRYQVTTSDDIADWEDSAWAAAICKVYESVRLLELFVVAS
jgi:hypothetical protein